MDQNRSPYRRALAWGIVAGLVVVVGAVAAYLLWGRDADVARRPQSVVVAALAEDTDGAVVCAAVFRLESTMSTASVTHYDPNAGVAIPGTSYDRLRDVYSFGGGDAVFEAVGQLDSGPGDAWVVLPSSAWIDLVNRAGGTRVNVPVETNVFIENELFVIGAGPQVLSGAEMFAMFSSLDYGDRESVSASLQTELSLALADVAVGGWSDVIRAVEVGDADASVGPKTLERFGPEDDSSP